MGPRPQDRTATPQLLSTQAVPPTNNHFVANVARLLALWPGSVLLPMPKRVTGTCIAMFLKLDIYYCETVSPAAYRSLGLHDRICYAIYDSSLLVSVLGKDNYNLPYWRKKEQPDGVFIATTGVFIATMG